MPDTVEVRLGDVTNNFDSRRVPIKTNEREPGSTPYYGASGVVDFVKGFTHDGDYLLVSEDGENLRTRSTPIAFMASGPIWVNNHAHVLEGLPGVADTRYLMHLLAITDVAGYLTGSTQPKLTRRALDSISLRVLPYARQRAIAEVLGALDDKIAANAALVTTADELASAFVRASIGQDRLPLTDVATVTMGSSPPGKSYNDAGEGVVFYQGVRDFGIRVPANRVWTTEPVRMAKPTDTLLSVRAPVGRTNLASEDTCIGRGLAALRSKDARPMTLFHVLRSDPGVWAPYESEGTVFGSINKKQLQAISVGAIPTAQQADLEARLAALESRIATALSESDKLATTRDALLPGLMSGKIRVSDAERVVEDVV